MAATPVSYHGTATVAATDYHSVKWVGKTKGGQTVTIEMLNALCKDNLEWTFAEKDDTVATITFEGAYSDTSLASGTRTPPYTITISDTVTAGAGEIVLGVGKFYVGTAGTTASTLVALTRGGGKFTSTREFREINADEDPGMVQGRVVLEGERPTLQLNALTWRSNVASLYPSLSTT